MKAFELLKSPERWTKRAFAKTKSGEPAGVFEECAFRFCIMGAITKCYGIGDGGKRSAARNKVLSVLGVSNLTVWNDAPARKHSEVLAALKKANV